MEHTGYILSLKGLKIFICEYGQTSNPFDATFYLNKDDAFKNKDELEEIYTNEIAVIKVKKTISIVD